MFMIIGLPLKSMLQYLLRFDPYLFFLCSHISSHVPRHCDISRILIFWIYGHVLPPEHNSCPALQGILDTNSHMETWIHPWVPQLLTAHDLLSTIGGEKSLFLEWLQPAIFRTSKADTYAYILDFYRIAVLISAEVNIDVTSPWAHKAALAGHYCDPKEPNPARYAACLWEEKCKWFFRSIFLYRRSRPWEGILNWNLFHWGKFAIS